VLKIFEEENLLQKADKLGQKLKKQFDTWQQDYQIIGDVRGLGPMLAMELVEGREAKEPASDKARALVKFCYEKGLIILTCGTYSNVIRTLMPLVITDDQLEKGLNIMEEGLTVLSK
jgi:4-aminobutyrate aminotransferase/(S)-3-amino-2-methylpropionate transaminase